MPWFLTPHGPHFVVEPGTIDEYERRDYVVMTAQQVTDFYDGVAFPDPPSFATEAEVLPIVTAAVQSGAGALPAALRAAFGARPVGAQASSAFNVSGMTGPAPTALTFPTGVLNNQITHPSVYFNPDGWNGWEWWASVTPYDGTTSAFENPYILVSHDGDTWQAPAGLTNPLDAKPAVGYNSDNHLLVGPDGRMYDFYRHTDDSTYDAIVVRSSRDGVTWSEEIELFRTGKGLAISPSFEYDGTQWVCFSVKGLVGVGATNTLERRTCATLTGTWSAPTTCTGLSFGAGREIWHAFVLRFMGRYYALIDDTADAQLPSTTQGNLYLATSADGLAWTTSPTPVLPRTGMAAEAYYRSCMVPKFVDGTLGFDVFAACISSSSGWSPTASVWRVGRSTVKRASSIFLSATQLKGALNAPADVVMLNRWHGWSLPDAASSSIVATVKAPPDWDRVVPVVRWVRTGTLVGDVRLQAQCLPASAGVALSGGTEPSTTATATAPAQNVFATTTLPAMPITPGSEQLHVRIIRVGADVLDTLGENIAITSVELLQG
jgi:hypothetical protein